MTKIYAWFICWIAMLASTQQAWAAASTAQPTPAAGASSGPLTFPGGAHWIWSPTNTADQWVAFRKSFSLAATPLAAPTTIAADTHYWLYVNGALVIFEGGVKRGPNWTDTYADQIDLAPYLTKGQNVVAILAWHLGKTGGGHQDSGAGGLLFESAIRSAAGSQNVVSDASWKQIPFPGYVHDTAGTQPNFRLPEWNIHFDAQQAANMAGWSTQTYSDAAWATAVDLGAAGSPPWNNLFARGMPAYRFTGLMNYLNQASLPQVSSGATIAAQLPSNLQVTPYLRIDAAPGQTITIQTDHYMDGGEANVRATYITKGGVQEFESLGWMSGTQVLYQIPAGVTIQALQYRESGYDTQFVGNFASNDSFYTSLWSKLQRTIYLNMRDTFMDCPTRERSPWWGDIALDIQAIPYMFDAKANALANKNIQQLAGWQRTSGVMFSPFPGVPSLELPTQTLASIAELGKYYIDSGDASALGKPTYAAVATYMRLWTLDSQGLVNHRAGDWDWEDWGGNIDYRVLDNAWFVKALDSTILLANLTGNGSDVAGWQALRNSIASNFDRVLWNAALQEYRSPGYTGDTDDRANALAVSAGLANPANYPAIANVLRGHQNASPYMESYVIEALYLMHDAIDAQNRMVSRYAPEVNGSGYTLWETWTPFGSSTDNHGWNGAPTMLSAYAAGLRSTAAGWSSYDAVPQLGKLTRIQATASTPLGALALAIDATTPTNYSLTLGSPTGSVGRLGLPILASSPSITANGVKVYQQGSPSGTVSGLQYLGYDANYVYFSVQPGQWTFLVAGTTRNTTTPATGWRACAAEGQLCLFSGTASVRYGSGSTFVTALLSNGTACNSATFGSDPTPNAVKHCDVYLDPNGPPGFAYCAAENGVCNFSGTAQVAYGASGKFTTLTLNNGTSCNNAVFGDPLYGTPKACYLATVDPWALCATEGGTCATAGGFGVVRYGAAGSYVFQVADGSVPCTNAAFGDPIYGTVKQCTTLPLPGTTGGWTACAAEGGSCPVTGTHVVAYGANGKFVFRMVSSPITCTNAAFGVDPLAGKVKACFID